MEPPRVLITTAGNLRPGKLLVHLPKQAGAAAVQATLTNCLTAVSKHEIRPQSLAIPYYGTELDEGEYWDIAQAMVNAVQAYENVVNTVNTCLTVTELVCPCLIIADVLASVARTILVTQQPTDSSTTVEVTDVTAPEQVQPAVAVKDEDQWYEIEKVLRKRRYRGHDQFLVVWKNTGGTQSWVDRKDLSSCALQEFLAEHPVKRRKRRC